MIGVDSEGMPHAVADAGIGPASLIRFHDLTIRQSDDDRDLAVVGQVAIREFVELPEVAVSAIRLLDQGWSIARTERYLASCRSVEVDVAGLVKGLSDLGFVAQIDGRSVPQRSCPPNHLTWLREQHVGWLFGRTAKLLFSALVLAAFVTVLRDPGLLPHPSDFYWTQYVGLATFVNTAMLAVNIALHELMHLLAARSVGVPSRIELGTRLYNLVAQTDVTAAWAVPRRSRYRVYLAGLAWDITIVCGLILFIRYGSSPPGMLHALSGALILMVLLSIAGQAQVFMRTDLYFVLLDLLRCRNLFHDGLAYVAHLASLIRLGGTRRSDPSQDLPPRERRAVRLYAATVVGGSTVALATFGFVAVPVLLEGVMLATSSVWTAVRGNDLLAAVDGLVLILVESVLLGLFLVTFHRSHTGWIQRATRLVRPRRHSL